MQRITLSPQRRPAVGKSSSDLIYLEADQIHYLRRVLRLKAGDRFIAQTGQGQQWLAALTDQADSAQVIAALNDDPLSAAPVVLIAALPKGNGFDQVVRQTTELGVTHIYPVLSDRTLLKPSSNKLERWRRIAQEASEQSERITVPNIFEPTDFEACLKQIQQVNAQKSQNSHLPLKYICVARNKFSSPAMSTTERQDRPHLLVDLLIHQRAKSAPANLPSLILAIGPEGGWTEREIAVAISYQYKTVSLGPAILRAVTAPITALSLVAAARELLI